MITRSRRLRGIAVVAAAVTAFTLAACSPAGSQGSSSTPNSAASSGGAGASASGSTAAGSSGASQSGGASTGATSQAPGGSTTSSGTFVVARTADIDKLDPHLGTAFTTLNTLGLIYESLVSTDNNGKLIPALATKWTVSKDGKTITFDLRTGVKWQDGDPFTSADVKASLDRILDQKTGAVARSNLTSIASVDTPNADTVVLHLSQPNEAIFYALSGTNAAIVHAKDIADGSVGKTPDGTGPFEFVSWQQGQQVTLKANPNYWGGAPKIATLEFRVIPTESSILSGMKANAFQLGILSDPSVAAQAAGASNFKLIKQASMSYHVLQLNGRRAPLTNIKVRQAIACAVNRQQVIDTAAFGDGKVTGPITSPNYQYSPTQGLPCKPGDVAAAKKLISESGVKTPINLKTIVMSDNYATAVPEAQNLQAQLKAIGVNLQLEQLPTSPYVKAWLAADYDAAVARNGGSSDPYLMYGRYFTTDGSLKGPAGLTSQTLNDLLVKGNTTSNESERQTIYRQLQEELLKESPWVWMFAEYDYYLVSNKVTGFTARADESLINLAKAGLS